jgi:hypothetical protein
MHIFYPNLGDDASLLMFLVPVSHHPSRQLARELQTWVPHCCSHVVVVDQEYLFLWMHRIQFSDTQVNLSTVQE